MGAYYAACGERFVEEFGADLNEALHVDAPCVVRQGLGLESLDERVHYYVVIRDAKGKEHRFVDDGAIFDPEHSEESRDEVVEFLRDVFLPKLSKKKIAARLKKVMGDET